LSFAADFYLSVPFKERQAEVDRLIRVLGLEKCANTLCGNQFLKGLSGGQKRRLSLALGLIKKPLVLFLDEPTSGLDSASASWIMSFLKDYVTQEGIAVICTIHQPSTAIFKQFDSTMLLSGGRVAYVGPAMDATAYFKDTFNADVPKDFSPAEFLLEYINSDFGDEHKKEEVRQILDIWSSKPAAWQNHPERAPLPVQGCRTTSFSTQVLCSELSGSAQVWLVSCLCMRAGGESDRARAVQVWINLRRQAMLSFRDPTIYMSRMVIFLLACCFFGYSEHILFVQVLH
jgi:ABC-type multidrug transport system ATPase subunit